MADTETLDPDVEKEPVKEKEETPDEIKKRARKPPSVLEHLDMRPCLSLVPRRYPSAPPPPRRVLHKYLPQWRELPGFASRR